MPAFRGSRRLQNIASKRVTAKILQSKGLQECFFNQHGSLMGYFYFGLIIAFAVELSGQVYLTVMQWLSRFWGLTERFSRVTLFCERNSHLFKTDETFSDSASMSIEITLMAGGAIGTQCGAVWKS